MWKDRLACNLYLVKVLPFTPSDGSISVAQCAQFDPPTLQTQCIVFYLPINGLINFMAKREEKGWKLARANGVVL